jgi:hypothetical protein
MVKEDKKQVDLSLILPFGLVLFEIITVVVMLALGYTISGFLAAFLVFLSVYLILQIVRQLLVRLQTKKAISGISKAAELVDSGQPMEAIKQWKKVIFNLPREEYVKALAKMEELYRAQDMTPAVQKTRDIRSMTFALINMRNGTQNMIFTKQRDFLSRVSALHKMIQDLPEDNSRIAPVQNPEE